MLSILRPFGALVYFRGPPQDIFVFHLPGYGLARAGRTSFIQVMLDCGLLLRPCLLLHQEHFLRVCCQHTVTCSLSRVGLTLAVQQQLLYCLPISIRDECVSLHSLYLMRKLHLLCYG
jgi:hypothetical protein